MYIGADFLLDRAGRLFLSEVNTGVPAGATEYDLVYKERKGEDSGIFDRIEAFSREKFGGTFREFVHSLPWLDDLKRLKIWMDGQGPMPNKPHPALRLEDKWVQYRILSSHFSLLPTRLWTPESRTAVQQAMSKGQRYVLKRRLTRGGKGFKVLDPKSDRAALPDPDARKIVQPYLESRIGGYAFSLRAAAFAGQFLCLFASLADRNTSNHGIRFLVSPGDPLKINPAVYNTRTIQQKSREADIFYRGEIPPYLHRDVHEEEIADAEILLPESHLNRIQQITSRISALYAKMDFSSLPVSWIEESDSL